MSFHKLFDGSRAQELPSCFGSNPNAQARAENDCETCLNECKKKCKEASRDKRVVEKEREKDRADAVARFHLACRRLTWINADDYAATRNRDGMRAAQTEYREACRLCERLGVDVAAETNGKGYLL